MDQHQKLIGSEYYFLQLKSNEYPYGEPSRIQYVWEQNIKWGVKDAWNQLLTRVNDLLVIDRICKHTKHYYTGETRWHDDISRYCLVEWYSHGWWRLLLPMDSVWFSYGFPTELAKRKCPLAWNMKIWREKIWRLFYGDNGISPAQSPCILYGVMFMKTKVMTEILSMIDLGSDIY